MGCIRLHLVHPSLPSQGHIQPAHPPMATSLAELPIIVSWRLAGSYEKR
jgi:hypothetical protein